MPDVCRLSRALWSSSSLSRRSSSPPSSTGRCKRFPVLFDVFDALTIAQAELLRAIAQNREQQQQQRASIEAAPKKIFEIDHTNASANSSGDGSGWTEVSVTPHVMEMKQASSFGVSAVYFFNNATQADIAAKSIRRFLRNLDTGGYIEGVV